MNFYFIDHEMDGEDFDLFVWAKDPEEAKSLHTKHYEIEIEDQDEVTVFIVDTVPPSEPKALRWFYEIKPT